MPLSFGIPIGLVIALIGLFLLFVTKSRKISIALIVFGALVAAFTLVVIVLASMGN